MDRTLGLRTLAWWLLAASCLPAQDPPNPLATKLDELCRPLIDANLAHGFVVGVIDGERTLVRGYGRIAPGTEQAPDAETLYEIGSLSKVFTGVLLADAVVRGALALDDPVQKFLPEGTVIASWKDVPVRLWHLSTHSSGLPRLPDMKGSAPADPYAHFSAERVFEALGKAELRWEPGSKYDYSNLAVGLLGLLLARHQGFATYEALLRERICAPLGLEETVVALDARRLKRLAPPHAARGGPAQLWDLAALAGAGGIRSSMRDLLAFARAQWAAEGPLVKATRLAAHKHHEGAGGIGMGLGWHIARDKATLLHNGQTGGYHSFLAVVPGSRRAVSILANSARGEFDAIGQAVLRHLSGIDGKPPGTGPR